MKQKSDNKWIFLGLLIVGVLAIVAFITGREETIDYNTLSEDEISSVIQENVNEIEKNKLVDMTERDRIEFYVSKFITEVENQNYEEAYEMLYEEFKTNYFPTLASFEEYAKTKLPSMFALDHTNFEKNGDVYVLWVTMYNPLGSKDSSIEMNFVVKEIELNNFTMSFSVI